MKMNQIFLATGLEIQNLYFQISLTEMKKKKREDFRKISRGDIPLLSDRIIQSMPNLMKDNDYFSLSIGSVESVSQNSISIKKLETLFSAEKNNCQYLEAVSYQISDHDSNNEGYRISVSLSNLSPALSNQFQDFYNDDYHDFEQLVKARFNKFAKEDYQPEADEITDEGELNVDYVVEKIMSKVDIIFTFDSDFSENNFRKA